MVLRTISATRLQHGLVVALWGKHGNGQTEVDGILLHGKRGLETVVMAVLALGGATERTYGRTMIMTISRKIIVGTLDILSAKQLHRH